ncbi:hypothetical protein FQR65_LT10674 [Abscondita terminalis]|nr:hypothetical protein FQR65_LT10674 [Abscondita terminalis]
MGMWWFRKTRRFLIDSSNMFMQSSLTLTQQPEFITLYRRLGHDIGKTTVFKFNDVCVNTNPITWLEASQVYGQFLVMNRDHVRFENWMKDNFGSDRRNASNCSKALDDYYTHFN